MDKICMKCRFNKGRWCNRLVVSGGFGMNDRTADDFLKNNQCHYFVPLEKGEKLVFEEKGYLNFNNS